MASETGREPAASMAKAKPGEVAAIGPRVYGVIDVLRADRVAGWAIDRGDSAAAVEIEVHREGRRVASLRADRHRRDLETGGVGTGSYGFLAELSPPLEPGFGFTVSVVARAADGTKAVLKRAGTAAAELSPDRRLLERVFEEQLRLRRDPLPGAGAEAERLRAAVERIEVVQARLEAALPEERTAPGRRADGGLRAIVFVTLGIALGSLGLGLYSLWLP
jgi:hypothetical protein